MAASAEPLLNLPPRVVACVEARRCKFESCPATPRAQRYAGLGEDKGSCEGYERAWIKEAWLQSGDLVLEDFQTTQRESDHEQVKLHSFLSGFVRDPAVLLERVGKAMGTRSVSICCMVTIKKFCPLFAASL